MILLAGLWLLQDLMQVLFLGFFVVPDLFFLGVLQRALREEDARDLLPRWVWFAFFGGLGGMAIVAGWWGVWDIIAGLVLASLWAAHTKRRTGSIKGDASGKSGALAVAPGNEGRGLAAPDGGDAQ